MSEARITPRRPAAAPLMGIFNAVPRAILRSPLHAVMSGRFILLGVTGRKTGRTYQIPVAYVEHEGTLLVGAGAPRVRNLSNGTPITVWYHGNRRQAASEIVRDPAEINRLVQVILESNPVWGRFNNIHLASNGQVDSEQLQRALKRGTTILRLRLAASGQW